MRTPSQHLSLTLLVPCLWAAGCAGDDAGPDATTTPRDAAAVNPDAAPGQPDATALPPDSGGFADAAPGQPDADPVMPDTGVPDTGVPDMGVPDSGVPAGLVWADVYRGVISQGCSCHNNGGAAGGLSFPNARADIADVRRELVTEGGQALCGGTQRARVVPGDSATSLLYLKVAGNSCGSQMPLRGAALPQASQDTIRDWIDQGAN